MEEQERERRRQVVEKFQKAPFEEIAAHCGARVRVEKKIYLTDVDCQNFELFSYMIFVFFFLLGHTTTEQTQSDL